MKKNKAVKNGFRTNLTYTREGSPAPAKARWKKDLPGALVLIGLIAEDTGDSRSMELNRNFAEQGVNPESLLNRVLSFLPWLPEWYREQTVGDLEFPKGRPLTAYVVYNRWHKMVYENREERELRGRRSGEHYLVHRKLKPLVPAVDALFNRGTVITRKELENVRA